jgi:hydroxypyruvate isomerase
MRAQPGNDDDDVSGERGRVLSGCACGRRAPRCNPRPLLYNLSLMNRRDFLQRTAAVASVLPFSAARVAASSSTAPVSDQAAASQPAAPTRATATKHTFKLKYAPHFGMFKNSAGDDLLDQLRFMADSGFMALEDNGLMKRPVEVQQQIGDFLAKREMTMGVFVIDGGDNWKISLATGKPEFRETFVKTCRAAVDVGKRVNAKWATVVPGYFERTLPIGIQTGHVIDALRAGAEILEPAKLTMVLEPLSDNPDLFLRTSDQAYAICRAVNSPSCKILYDIYHMQRNEGHLIPHMELAWDEIAYFQIGDVPGRKEPTTGEINYKHIFKHLHAKLQATKRDAVFGMEHGNSQPGIEGEQKLIEAYVWSDDF